MTHSSPLTFGPATTFGELARGTDELSIEMALVLGRPAGAWPSFATVPVLLNNAQIGVLSKIVFVNGDTVYEFLSDSGNTKFCCTSTDAALHHLHELLGFAGPLLDES